VGSGAGKQRASYRYKSFLPQVVKFVPHTSFIDIDTVLPRPPSHRGGEVE